MGDVIVHYFNCASCGNNLFSNRLICKPVINGVKLIAATLVFTRKTKICPAQRPPNDIICISLNYKLLEKSGVNSHCMKRMKNENYSLIEFV